jgi:glycolate oxidase FAD binding subunit
LDGGPSTLTPHSASELAAALAHAAAEGRAIRIRGGGTKINWGGGAIPDASRSWSWLETRLLDRVTVREDGRVATLAAGTSMARLQSILARSGVMLAVDPQLGLGQRGLATVGGVVACADGGPLAHRYGSVGDQIEGVTVATPDGSLLQTGPAAGEDSGGFDLARLVAGAFGTLGVIVSVDARLHELPRATASATGTAQDASTLWGAAMEVAARHRDLQALDVAWRGGRGAVLAQAAGELAAASAGTVAGTMREQGLEKVSVVGQDAMLWARQRAAQRSLTEAVLRVLTPPTALPLVAALTDQVGGTLVGRAALGVYYMTLQPSSIATIRAGLPDGASAVVLDLPPDGHRSVDRYGATPENALSAARRLKARYDPHGVCNPGVFIGGI